MDKDRKELPLAESSVSRRLAEIRRRCSELLAEPEALDLSLEDAVEPPDGTNPYNLG